MAEAIGLGASVVAFIGTAGQVLQGWQYISTLFDDVKDAPDDIKSLDREVNMLVRMLTGFKTVLTDISHMDDHAAIGSETKQALDYCDEAMVGLMKFLLKIKRAGTKWNQLRFAFSKDKVLKHLSRIQNAKEHILLAQATIIL